MAHERTELRQAVIAQLKGPSPYRTAAGVRVYPAREAPVPGDSLPAISVYINEEATTEASKRTTPRELERRCSLVIEGHASVAAASIDTLDDVLDALALEIETAIDLDRSIDRHASDFVYSRTEIGRTLAGSRPMGVVVLTYEAAYRSNERNVAPVDDFDTMGTTTKIDGVTMPAADDAENLNEDIHE